MTVRLAQAAELFPIRILPNCIGILSVEEQGLDALVVKCIKWR